MRYGRVAAVIVVFVAILVGEWLWLRGEREQAAVDGLPVVTTDAAAPGGPFSLVNHFGEPVTDQSYRGKYLVMVFGYTFCPDVCPTTLNTVVAAMALLGTKADAVQPLFVTVDPDRDTPAVLAQYVASFDSRMIGLSGSPEQIRQVAQDYRVYVAKGDGGGDAYTVDHSAFVYLIGPDGRVLTYLKHDATPEAMAKALERLMTQQTSFGSPWN